MQGGTNLYSYVSNNPISKTDPLGLYEIDVHYYLTYYLAKKTGCFTDPQSRAIANADQGTDEAPKILSGTRRFHALHKGVVRCVGASLHRRMLRNLILSL